MLTCPKCNTDNELGRVFCSSCGGKLDLTRMKREDVAEAQKPSLIRRLLPWVVIVAVVLVFAIAGLALWPVTGSIGKEGDRKGGAYMARQLNVLNTLKENRSLKVSFTEENINGYLTFFKAEKLKVNSVSMSITNGCFSVRAVRTLGAWKVFKYKDKSFNLTPTISIDLTCAVAGGKLSVSSASMGHLPLLGPARSPAVNAFQSAFAAEKDWACFKDASEIEAANGKLSFVIKK